MIKHKKTRVVNLYGGPGTGKSTTAAGVFNVLKKTGVNIEYVQEYAKDLAWEFAQDIRETGKSPKHFQAQEMIFAQQNWRMRRLDGQVDLIVTDGPFVLGLAYLNIDFPMPSLRKVLLEAHSCYDNLDIFLERCKPYNSAGRSQTEAEAKELDGVIKSILAFNCPNHLTLQANERIEMAVAAEVFRHWPELTTNSPGQEESQIS